MNAIIENPSARLVWIDIETTGLIPQDEEILEIGLAVTTTDLEIVAQESWLIWGPEQAYRIDEIREAVRKNPESSYKWILETHGKSGLLDEAKAHGDGIRAVESRVKSWLATYAPVEDGAGRDRRDPMAGSSVQFDRAFLLEHMPSLHNVFSYRNIDVSTVKELIKRTCPNEFKELEAEMERSARKLHRVKSDIEDSINELRDYFVFLEI